MLAGDPQFLQIKACMNRLPIFNTTRYDSNPFVFIMFPYHRDIHVVLSVFQNLLEQSGVFIKIREMNKRRGIVDVGSIFMHADRADWLLMGLGLFGCVADGVSKPLALLIISILMNNIGNVSTLDPDELRHCINKNALIMVYLACASFLSCFIEGYCWTRTAERQAARIRVKYLKAVLRQDVSYFDSNITSTSEVITCVSHDSILIQDVLSEKVPNFLTNCSNFIGSSVVSFIMLWKLAIVGFPFVVLLIIPGLLTGRALIGLARKISSEYNHAGRVAEQAVSSIRTVYAFVAEKKTIAAFSSALQDLVKLGLIQGLVKGIAIGSNAVVFAIWSFMSYYGSRLVMYHGAKGGTVFAIISAIITGGLSLGAGLSNLKNISEAISAGERIMEVIKRFPKIDSESNEGIILENVSGEVEFNQVRFAYPSRHESPVLVDFSLKVPAGKTVALVGGSGSGKSTVISLLQRFYDPIGGEILLDGVAIHKLPVKWLRSQMGLVSQEPALFATSIMENILFGKEDATMEEVVVASKAANAHGFISQLPQGYNTQVGEKGAQMSGGQKQRIAIARALVKSPKILLLDEATSALDSESERSVQEAVDRVASGRTTIIIAHRLSTVRNADIIAVVQHGKVMELGSHEELTKKEYGLYTSLVHLQRSDTENKLQATHEAKVSDSPFRSLHYSMSHRVSKGSSRISRASSRFSVESPENVEIAHVGQDSSIDDEIFPKTSFRRLLAISIPEWKHATIGCLSAMLFGVVQPLHSFAMGTMSSVYFLKDHHEIQEKTKIYALCFLGLSVFAFLINVSQHYNFAYMGENLTRRVRERMLSMILTFEVGWFDKQENSSGTICSRLAKDANVVRTLVGDRMALLTQILSSITLAFALGLVIAWKLAIVMIAVQPLVIACYYTRLVLLKSMSKKATESQYASSKLAAESISNLRTITSFCSQERILKMLEKAQEGPYHENLKQSWYAGIGLASSQALMTCTWALSFWYGGKLVYQNQISSKSMFQTYLILVSSGRSIADAGSMTTDLAKGSNAIRSVFLLLDRSTKIEPDDKNGRRVKKVKGHIELQNVCFAYPSRPNILILEDFSVTIQARRSTALVGHSGCGKSTIIGLIERFYDTSKGIVMIDGRDIRSYHLRSLRKHIALVSQEPTLFSGTMRENIAYGASSKIDEIDMIEAAKAANAHDFISSLNDGYDTWCGDKGVQLSGGQKQRIAIARAILKNPAVLLLDEATSALDSHSEKVVQDALERVMVGRTSVVVAHRLSTIRNCDLIVVLNKGKVVEKGTHSFLMSKRSSGVYYSLASLQMTSQN